MDKVTEILLDGLRQALSRGEQQRLYRSGKLEGLFPGRAGAGGEAAARALREGLLEVARSETRGKTVIEWVRLTPQGVDFLHEHESPVRALHDLREILSLNQQAIPNWLERMHDTLQALDRQIVDDARQWLGRLESLERRVSETLRRIEAAFPLVPEEVAAAHPWTVSAVKYLDRRQDSGAPDTCSLPELFSALLREQPQLSISAFHEGLRQLQKGRLIQLHPADDPGDLPQPEFALLDDAAVCYHASR